MFFYFLMFFFIVKFFVGVEISTYKYDAFFFSKLGLFSPFHDL